MLSVLNSKLSHLVKGAEGYAVALTIVVWPMMLLMVSGIYVTGENVRRKVLMQMEADTAATAGAVVQADVLGRIAVLDRMMAWTYLQANKMEMDYVVGTWLTDVVSAMTTAGAGTALLNGNTSPVTKGQITTALTSFDAETLKDKLDNAYLNISSMKSALDDQVTNGKTRITAAIDGVLAANSMDMGGKQTAWNNVSDMSGYISNTTDETVFLSYASASSSDMKTGYDTWWQLESGELRRGYAGTTTCLKATVTGVGGVDYVLATNAYENLSGNKKTAAIPRWLNSNYTQQGAITVALKHPLENPMEIIIGTLAGSWFDAYTIDGTDMWCVAAARACPYDSTNGGYSLSQTTFTTDWAASLISLKAASSTGLASDLIHSAYTGLETASGWADSIDWTILDAKAVH